MNTRVNYIVANYIGPLRSYAHYQGLFDKDPLFFFKKHIDFLSKLNSDQITATFVFNDDIDPKLKFELLGYNFGKFEIIFRKNSGFSYGIWNDTIIKNLNDYDFFFLIEDDYIPSRLDFLDPFLDRLKDKVAFVCGLIEEASPDRFPDHVPYYEDPFPFPSISNGLISAEACRTIFKKYETIFKINLNNDYNSAYTNQIYFCKYFTDNGYNITDTLDEFSSSYNNATQRELVIYGDKKPSLLEPIII